MFDLSSDLKSAFRSLFKAPGTTTMITATLAAAIAATTVGFCFVDFAVLRGMPVDDKDRVVIVYGLDPRQGDGRARLSLANALSLRQRSQTLEHLAAFRSGRATLVDQTGAVGLDVSRTTADFFVAMGLGPALGRVFEASDDRQGAPRVAVLSHQYWTEIHGSNPQVIGRSLLINGTPHTVVGVAPPELGIGNLALIDMWLAVPFDEGNVRGERAYTVIARLRDGHSLDDAKAEFEVLSAGLARDYPDTNDGWRFRPVPIQEAFGGSGFWVVIALFALGVSLIMAIACANVANLVLVRATSRSREMAMRTALGASRLRLARQLLFEGLLLSAIGGIIGWPLAEVALSAIRAAGAEPAIQQMRLDAHELLLVIAVVLTGPLLFSFAPALISFRANLVSVLQSGHARVIGAGGRARSALVVVQLALATMLLVAAGLAVRSAINITAVAIGVRLDNVLTFTLDLDAREYPSVETARTAREQLLERLQSLPGVDSAHAVEMLPVLEDARLASLLLADHHVAREQDRPWAMLSGVDDGALAALHVPLIAGRWLYADEVAKGAAVALVSKEAAMRYYGSLDSALEQMITVIDRGQTREVRIVGIVGDVLGRNLEDGPQPRVWTPLGDARRFAVLVTTRTAPRDVASAARAVATEIMPQIPVERLEAYDEAFARFRASDYVVIGVFAGFALLALVLAATGLYGVVSFTVSQRTAEFGTRLALGAQMRDVMLMVVKETLRLLLVGLSIGVGFGLVLSQAMQALLYGVSPMDIGNLALVLSIMTLVALAASAVPALRAARVDVLHALRAE